MKKINKFIMFITVCFICTFGISIPAFAVSNNSIPMFNGANDNVPISSQEELQLKKASDAKLAKAAQWFNQVKMTALPASGETYIISVTNIRQQENYWCGPCSVLQDLTFHKAKSGSSTPLPSQQTLATQSHTIDLHGGWTPYLVDTINSYATTYSFGPYVATHISTETDPVNTFRMCVKDDIANRVAVPTIKAYTQYIPRYKGQTGTHYISLSGYSNTTSGETIQTTDCNYYNPYYGVYWDAFGSKTVNGICRAAYMADVGNSNHSLMW